MTNCLVEIYGRNNLLHQLYYSIFIPNFKFMNFYKTVKYYIYQYGLGT